MLQGTWFLVKIKGKYLNPTPVPSPLNSLSLISGHAGAMFQCGVVSSPQWYSIGLGPCDKETNKQGQQLFICCDVCACMRVSVGVT